MGNSISLKFKNEKDIPQIPTEPAPLTGPQARNMRLQMAYNAKMSKYLNEGVRHPAVLKLDSNGLNSKMRTATDTLMLRSNYKPHLVVVEKDRRQIDSDRWTLGFLLKDNKKEGIIDEELLKLLNRSFNEVVEISSSKNILKVDLEGETSRLIFKNENVNVSRYRGKKIVKITILPEETNDITTIVEPFSLDDMGIDTSDTTTRWVLVILVLLVVYYLYTKKSNHEFRLPY